MRRVRASEGVGPLTAACLIAELGDPARFDSPGAIASYVGVIPRIRQSGKKRFTKGSAIPLGNADRFFDVRHRFGASRLAAKTAGGCSAPNALQNAPTKLHAAPPLRVPDAKLIYALVLRGWHRGCSH